MKWLENLKSKLGAKDTGEKTFGSLVEVAEYARKHKGAIPLNPFAARPPAAPAEMEKR